MTHSDIIDNKHNTYRLSLQTASRNCKYYRISSIVGFMSSEGRSPFFVDSRKGVQLCGA